MNQIRNFFILTLFVLMPPNANAQRHLPNLQIFQTTEYVQLDTFVEHPAINQGVAFTGTPARGENVVFQIFVPRSGGYFAYQCGIQLKNPQNTLTNNFENISVVDWQKNSLTPSRDTNNLIYDNQNLTFALVPISGHIATVTLTPKESLQNPLPINLTCSVTVVSIPPRRVWQMTGPQTLHWR